MLKNNFYNDSKGRSYFTPRLLLKFVCIISFFRFNQYMVLKMKKKSYLARHIFFLKFRIEIKKKKHTQTNMHFKYLTIWWYDNCLIESYVYFWCLSTIFESRQFFDAQFYIQWERKSFVYFFFFLFMCRLIFLSVGLHSCILSILFFIYVCIIGVHDCIQHHMYYNYVTCTWMTPCYVHVCIFSSLLNKWDH